MCISAPLLGGAVPDYYRSVEPGLIWALKHIPFYAEFHRARMILVFADRSWPAVVGDPAWEDQSLSMNEANHGMREALTEFMRESLGPKQDYLEHCVPNFPVWGKRLIVDNGWYETLARQDVSLETDGIERVTATGIQTSAGEHHELDVIIHATGFKANHFLMPMKSSAEVGKPWVPLGVTRQALTRAPICRGFLIYFACMALTPISFTAAASFIKSNARFTMSCSVWPYRLRSLWTRWMSELGPRQLQQRRAGSIRQSGMGASQRAELVQKQ